MLHHRPNTTDFRLVGGHLSPPDLPVYRLDKGKHSIFYSPGLVAVVDSDRSAVLENYLLSKDVDGISEDLINIGMQLTRRAREALELYNSFYTRPFEPRCLTLYIHESCNLSCEYCLLQDNTGQKRQLHPNDIVQAARVVAENCRQQGTPFNQVFHGWGEPASNLQLIRELLQILDDIAKEFGIPQHRHIATNGVMSPEVAEFLSRHFDSVGLSCDGPDHIQNRFRPLRTGGSTAEQVRQTAGILRKQQCSYFVRSTITNQTISAQEEIADYIIRVLKPAYIRFEPVYRAKNGGFSDSDAEVFADSFFRAKTICKQNDISLACSGSRLAEVHGPYCNVFRSVVNLLPDARVTSCFIKHYGDSAENFVIGHSTPSGFELNKNKVRVLQAGLGWRPDICRKCFNNYHCVALCPDFCPVDAVQKEVSYEEHFRCRLFKNLARKEILEEAEQLLVGQKVTLLRAWNTLKNSTRE